MPLDTTSTSPRTELAAITKELQQVAVARDEAQEHFARLEKPAKLLDEDAVP